MSFKTAYMAISMSLASIIARGDCFTGRSFCIDGTNFVFQFEDDCLNPSNKMRIADDVIGIRNFGVSSKVRLTPVSGFDGYIYDDNLEDPPYFNCESLQFPRYFNVVNSTNMLVIPKNLSDAYTNVFSFLDSNTNMFYSVRPFIESLATNRLDLIPSNQIWRIVYYRNADPATYTLARDEIVSELKQQRYGVPSALSFHQTGPGTNGFPHAATWMRVPCLNWSSFDHKYLISMFHAFWYDGIWRLYPTEW